MKTKILLLLTFLFAAFSAALHATEKNDSAKFYFHSAFDELKSMMEGKQPAIFERAVFISENPFHNNKYTYSDFYNGIDFHLFFIQKLADANDYSDTMNYIPKVKANGRFDIDEILISPTKKKELYKNALNNWAIYTYMEDTTIFSGYYHAPYNYSTADPFGMKDWSNSQLLNLLISENQEGNCFALTAFFKIMADRLKTGAYICTAPQHIYIQHQNEKGNYYNVELATAGHPRDGMLQTLTYTTSTAIQNGISLRSYDDRQSIGLCMVNLAKAYEHKFNTKDDDFLLQCAETVLQNDSLNLNALLLKHQVLNERMLKIMSKNKTVFLSKLTNEQTFKELEKHLARLHRLGYIQMPMDVQEMVLNGFEEVKQGKKIDRNPKPFTIEGVPEEENQFYTMTGGVFQEVFEPKKFEEYGQFTFDTETKTIAAIDTTKKNFALIDPVAFAYDFGARIYDARVGRFMSIDPLTKSFPYYTPYQFAGNQPIWAIDLDGLEEFIIHNYYNNYGIITKTIIRTATKNDVRINQKHPQNSENKNVEIVSHFEGVNKPDFSFQDNLTAKQEEYLTQAKNTSYDIYKTQGGGDYTGIIMKEVEVDFVLTGRMDGSEKGKPTKSTSEIFDGLESSAFEFYLERGGDASKLNHIFINVTNEEQKKWAEVNIVGELKDKYAVDITVSLNPEKLKEKSQDKDKSRPMAGIQFYGEKKK